MHIHWYWLYYWEMSQFLENVHLKHSMKVKLTFDESERQWNGYTTILGSTAKKLSILGISSLKHRLCIWFQTWVIWFSRKSGKFTIWDGWSLTRWRSSSRARPRTLSLHQSGQRPNPRQWLHQGSPMQFPDPPRPRSTTGACPSRRRDTLELEPHPQTFLTLFTPQACRKDLFTDKRWK